MPACRGSHWQVHSFTDIRAYFFGIPADTEDELRLAVSLPLGDSHCWIGWTTHTTHTHILSKPDRCIRWLGQRECRCCGNRLHPIFHVALHLSQLPYPEPINNSALFPMKNQAKTSRSSSYKIFNQRYSNCHTLQKQGESGELSWPRGV